MGQQSGVMAARLRHHRFGFAIVVFATLVGYVYASCPALPTPAWLYRHAPLRERFPCEGHVCGCMNASDCWANCCCMSPEEHVAWASANGVEPPKSARGMLMAAARARTEGPTQLDGKCPLCRAVTSESTPPAAIPASSKPFSGIAMSALGCRGFAGWTLAGLPPTVLFGSAGPPLASPRVTLLLRPTRIAASRVIAPSVPPPRLG